MPADRRHLLRALAVTALPVPAAGSAALPSVSVGTLERLADVPSRHVAPRHVDVWLPGGFRPDGSHAVLVMHDGQMLYDARTTWNRQAWDVHRPASRLMAQQLVRPFVVVGVWNTGNTRFAEYFPQGFIEHVSDGRAREVLLARALNGAPLADAYLRFLVEELLPAVQARFGTARGPEATCLAGSSMGGLISLYALTEYPQVFGGAACLSTHWIGGFERNAEIPAAALAYLQRKLPPPGRHRLYMDRGTDELDALYDQAQEQVDALMRAKGFTAPRFDTRVFEGAGHNERAWAERLHIPLQHLLGA
jgi:enterochelin esterase-like enzyme